MAETIINPINPVYTTPVPQASLSTAYAAISPAVVPTATLQQNLSSNPRIAQLQAQKAVAENLFQTHAAFQNNLFLAKRQQAVDASLAFAKQKADIAIAYKSAAAQDYNTIVATRNAEQRANIAQKTNDIIEGETVNKALANGYLPSGNPSAAAQTGSTFGDHTADGSTGYAFQTGQLGSIGSFVGGGGSSFLGTPGSTDTGSPNPQTLPSGGSNMTMLILLGVAGYYFFYR